RSRTRNVTVVAIVAVLGALGLWVATSGEDAPLVEVRPARSAADAGATSVLDASGYVTARRQATVSAKITGKVTEVLIEEGMRVAEGDLLARLDSTEADAQLAL